MIEQLRRALCRFFGHRTVLDGRAEPVISPFNVCLRCGKWWRPAR